MSPLPGVSEPFQPDPYAAFRQSGFVDTHRGDQHFTLFVNFDDVRRIARDWRTFTSDTPFEVPIPHEHDVRSVRQLPIETDPPEHTAFRSLVEPFFSRSAVEAHAPVVRRVVDEALGAASAKGQLDVIRDLALPTVNHALAAALGLPDDDVRLWLNWGTHVFLADGSGVKRSNAQLDGYLRRVVDDALEGRGDGLFGALAQRSLDGRRLTREELLGFANLLFAGGRDTVISGIATSLVVLAYLPEAIAWLRLDTRNVKSAIEEILRIQSPLSYIGRHATCSAEVAGRHLDAGDLVALGFGAANRDPAVFHEPDVCRLDRRPNRQIAFGHGPHTCLGAHLARLEMRIVLERVSDRFDKIELLQAVRHRTIAVGTSVVRTSVEEVIVQLTPRAASSPRLAGSRTEHDW
jgi:cytochrome P450